MNISTLEKLPLKEQKSLFKINMFFILGCSALLVLSYYECKTSVNSFNERIRVFKSGDVITCKNKLISLKRGWIIDKNKKIFIKADDFVVIKDCKGVY